MESSSSTAPTNASGNLFLSSSSTAPTNPSSSTAPSNTSQILLSSSSSTAPSNTTTTTQISQQNSLSDGASSQNLLPPSTTAPSATTEPSSQSKNSTPDPSSQLNSSSGPIKQNPIFSPTTQDSAAAFLAQKCCRRGCRDTTTVLVKMERMIPPISIWKKNIKKYHESQGYKYNSDDDEDANDSTYNKDEDSEKQEDEEEEVAKEKSIVHSGIKRKVDDKGFHHFSYNKEEEDKDKEGGDDDNSNDDGNYATNKKLATPRAKGARNQKKKAKLLSEKQISLSLLSTKKNQKRSRCSMMKPVRQSINSRKKLQRWIFKKCLQKWISR